MDWRDFVEEQSVVEKDPPHRSRRAFIPTMDFATRDAYRHTVERVAKWSQRPESNVADLVITLARERQERSG